MPTHLNASQILDDDGIRRTLDDLANSHAIERIWTRDHTLWKPDPTEIENRLGWLTVLDHMHDGLADLRSFAQASREANTTDVVLLGMGGSSLGPEVLRCTFGSSKGSPRLWVLDSTVPGWVRHVTTAIQPARTLFLVASKSGGTIEVMSLFAHFGELVQRTKGNRGGAQFVAITDLGTGLEQLARDRRILAYLHQSVRYRRTILRPVILWFGSCRPARPGRGQTPRKGPRDAGSLPKTIASEAKSWGSAWRHDGNHGPSRSGQADTHHVSGDQLLRTVGGATTG